MFIIFEKRTLETKNRRIKRKETTLYNNLEANKYIDKYIIVAI